MSNNSTAFCETNHAFNNDPDDSKVIENEPLEEQVLFFKKRYEELQNEFEEFQMGSRELETELETQLHIYENRLRDLDSKNQQLTNDNEYLRSKLDKVSTESRKTIIELQEKLQQITEINEQLSAHIRDLEQSNDDLERAKRHLDSTLQDFDSKLNEQIERNELLESEIGEKEELHAVIQRLKDEARDLRHELLIQQSATTSSTTASASSTNNTGTGTVTVSAATQVTPINTNRKLRLSDSLPLDSSTKSNGSVLNGTDSSTGTHDTHNDDQTIVPLKPSTVTTIPLLSASSRISALNIVSDLLRKVGALESKLASCRTIVPVSSTLKNINNPIKTVSSNRSTGNDDHSDVGA